MDQSQFLPVTDYKFYQDYGDAEAMGNIGLNQVISNYKSPHNVLSDFTWGLIGKRPKLGLDGQSKNGGIQFKDNNISTIGLTTLRSIPQPLTVVFIGRRKVMNATRNQSYIFHKVGGTVMHVYIEFNASNDLIKMRSAATTLTATVALDATMPSGQALLYFVFNGTSSEIFLNNVSVATGDAGTAGFGAAANTILGRQIAGGKNRQWGQLDFPGSMEALIIYDRVLSSDDRDQLHEWFLGQSIDPMTI